MASTKEQREEKIRSAIGVLEEFLENNDPFVISVVSTEAKVIERGFYSSRMCDGADADLMCAGAATLLLPLYGFLCDKVGTESADKHFLGSIEPRLMASLNSLLLNKRPELFDLDEEDDDNETGTTLAAALKKIRETIGEQ